MFKSEIILEYIFCKFLLIIMMILLCSCKSIDKLDILSHKTFIINKQHDPIITKNFKNKHESKKIICNSNIKSKIMHQYNKWKGVPYRLGGNNKNGIDCSAFVQLTFKEQFGLYLPRLTSQQKKIGKHISRNRLCTGDILIFKAGSTGRHVGIYIDKNQFIHVSTSSGITISNINEHYWKKRYDEARRILICN